MPKKIISLVFIFLGLLAIYNLGKQISTALTAGQRLDKAVDEYSSLQEENKMLRGKLSQVSQYSFVEGVIRNKLNMSKPGETVVIIPQEAIDNILGAEKKMPEVKLPNWQGWLKLIFH